MKKLAFMRLYKTYWAGVESQSVKNNSYIQTLKLMQRVPYFKGIDKIKSSRYWQGSESHEQYNFLEIKEQ
jgi:hypothetical protein